MRYTGLDADTLNQASDEKLIAEAMHGGDALCRELACRLEREIGEHAAVQARLGEIRESVRRKNTDRMDRFLDKQIERLKTRNPNQENRHVGKTH